MSSRRTLWKDKTKGEAGRRIGAAVVLLVGVVIVNANGFYDS